MSRICKLFFVGRLAPQIGDYDNAAFAKPAIFKGRKTCPTNRGLRLEATNTLIKTDMSEDLPHKSGITTSNEYDIPFSFLVGRLAPQIGDYDLP
ncbi:hypothetical protein NEICINOT_03508 [Neisseria cinerea ATCC 14685]|uniref:Uncharacterized protein n=1 Tax=Neisseria cinerea ATCC 14685 TaxID=546262 RepID=D0W1I5_NEICI|nr:hypothetical protein NEICINOT_03508 [Neisseria cinerea ATCC 14685]